MKNWKELEMSLLGLLEQISEDVVYKTLATEGAVKTMESVELFIECQKSNNPTIRNLTKNLVLSLCPFMLVDKLDSIVALQKSENFKVCILAEALHLEILANSEQSELISNLNLFFQCQKKIPYDYQVEENELLKKNKILAETLAKKINSKQLTEKKEVLFSYLNREIPCDFEDGAYELAEKLIPNIDITDEEVESFTTEFDNKRYRFQIYQAILKTLKHWDSDQLNDKLEFLVKCQNYKEIDSLAEELALRIETNKLENKIYFLVNYRTGLYSDHSARDLLRKLALKAMQNWNEKKLGFYLEFFIECHNSKNEDICKSAKLLAQKIPVSIIEKKLEILTKYQKSNNANILQFLESLFLRAFDYLSQSPENITERCSLEPSNRPTLLVKFSALVYLYNAKKQIELAQNIDFLIDYQEKLDTNKLNDLIKKMLWSINPEILTNSLVYLIKCEKADSFKKRELAELLISQITSDNILKNWNLIEPLAACGYKTAYHLLIKALENENSEQLAKKIDFLLKFFKDEKITKLLLKIENADLVNELPILKNHFCDADWYSDLLFCSERIEFIGKLIVKIEYELLIKHEVLINECIKSENRPIREFGNLLTLKLLENATSSKIVDQLEFIISCCESKKYLLRGIKYLQTLIDTLSLKMKTKHLKKKIDFLFKCQTKENESEYFKKLTCKLILKVLDENSDEVVKNFKFLVECQSSPEPEIKDLAKKILSKVGPNIKDKILNIF